MLLVRLALRRTVPHGAVALRGRCSGTRKSCTWSASAPRPKQRPGQRPQRRRRRGNWRCRTNGANRVAADACVGACRGALAARHQGVDRMPQRQRRSCSPRMQTRRARTRRAVEPRRPALRLRPGAWSKSSSGVTRWPSLRQSVWTRLRTAPAPGLPRPFLPMPARRGRERAVTPIPARLRSRRARARTNNWQPGAAPLKPHRLRYGGAELHAHKALGAPAGGEVATTGALQRTTGLNLHRPVAPSHPKSGGLRCR